MCKKYLLSVAFFIGLLLKSFSQLSIKHYIPPVTSDGNDISEQYIYISTPKNSDVTFTIITVGNPSNEYSGVVSNANPFLYRIVENGEDPNDPGANLDTDGDSQLAIPESLSNTVMSDRGYIIEASDPIYVSVRFRSSLPNQFQAGALVSKGLSALGTSFRAGGMATANNNLVGGFLTYLSVMATEDNTNVSFDDFVPGITIINHSGSGPISTNLNEGESFMIAVGVDYGGIPNDLIGTFITSDNPIVVNSGSGTGSFADGSNGRDFGIDQIVDASKVGNEYIFVRGNGGGDGLNTTPNDGDQWENILIIAHQNNTNIFVNDGISPETSLDAGEWIVIEGDGINNNGNGFNANGNLYVQTSNPVFAYQGIGGQIGSSPNQGMFFVPPLSCENRGDVDNIANIDNIGNAIFSGSISIVTNRLAVVTINGLPISNFSPQGPFTVDGNSEYVTYKVALSGNVTVQSTGELYCAYFNQNSFASSGSFYSGFPSPPEINLDTNITALGNCIPNLTLESVNTDLFDSVEWFYDSGSGFVSTGNTTSSLSPNEPGYYKLVGTLSCSGGNFESQIIPVSICPDDVDNDLIIDNIDVDLDNDGIVNCDESLGNANINFTSINAPTVIFQNGTSDPSFISTSINQTGTSSITGDGLSNFTTTISPSGGSDLEYTLNFSSSSNVELVQNPSIVHTVVSGETFTLIVGPNTKNITLLDPDNILLVDTDFDDVFETGVDNFSSAEIRFRFNPTPNGTTPYKMVANSVDQITFKHLSINTTSNSVFEGNLILTCFGIDSDNDGIDDAFDADSDNDGISDLVEAQGVNVSILGTDANLDGLDDVFTSPINAIDTDSDGISDYLDVDSDNDGVYDLFEAGHGQPDTDLNGVIDNSTATVGMNGLVDALETSPDNSTLNYSVSDRDSDATFDYLDPDSDGDGCPDVIEAGFSDPDNDDKIGMSPVSVNSQGKVIGISDGFTIPDPDYSTSAPILLNTPFEDVTFCEESTFFINIDSNADTFQWEVSNDGGANWTRITNTDPYNGASTASLEISNVQRNFNGNLYRVFLQKSGNSCNEFSNEISLTVNSLPTITPIVELKQCDDDTDGFSNFNLNEVASDISTNYVNETFIFYSSLIEAENDINAFSDSEALVYRNRKVTSDTVWARVISSAGCFLIAQVNLVVSTTGLPTTFQRDFFECDDFLDSGGANTINNDDTDGISSFDFSSVTAEVRALFPSSQQLTVSYYRNQADALSETNKIIDPSNYRNIGSPNYQQIYIRVDSDLDNDCIGFGPFISLYVDPVPEVNPHENLVLCDDGDDGDFFNGIVQTFDLESQTSIILGSQDPLNITVSYHSSAAEARAGTNPILNTTQYENTTPYQQTIHTRITNTTTGCFTIRTFDLIVNELPVANYVNDLEVCDDNSDGSAQNGFSQNFDLELQTEGILGSQDPNQFRVSYHASLADAQAGTMPLGSPFSNSIPFSQIIYARVYNLVTGCANGISNFNAVVNPRPTVEEIPNLSYCDDDTDGDDTNGFIQNIDLESRIPDLLGPLQNQNDFNVSFHETKADATLGTNALSSPYSNTKTNQQTLFVRIENKDTGCVNDDLAFRVIVHPLPQFKISSPQIACLTGPPLTLFVENPINIYDYVWTLPDGTPLIEEEITVSSGGVYTVTGTQTNGTGCVRTREIQVNESAVASITEDHVSIVDDSENNSISIDPSNLGIGNYEYALIDENGQQTSFQDIPIFENLKGGFYTIVIQDINGCKPNAELPVSIIEFPKFFTPNNDGINDTWSIKGINTTFFPSAQIYIFNRFGKVLVKMNADSVGWDGTYGGKKLPSDDYWFSVNLVDKKGFVRTRRGNFSLIRRE